MSEVIGAIKARWDQNGGAAGAFGAALDIERPTFDGVGRSQEFEHATISWHPELGAFWTWGGIRDKWTEFGREQFGYLLCDEVDAGDNRGKINHYRTMQLPDRPDASIYWTGATGAHEVHGGIRARWSELGWQTSWLGYPTSDEYSFVEGGRVSTFERGAIYWWPDTGALELGDIVVRYTGMNCFGTDDPAPAEDEPYPTVGIIGPTGNDQVFQRGYTGVTAGGSFPASDIIFRGAPAGVGLLATLIEHDSGDPASFKSELDRAMVAAAAGVVAGVTAIPAIGPAIAVVAAPLIAEALPGLTREVSSWLADDKVGSAPILLSPKQLVTLPTHPEQRERDVAFHVQTPLLSNGAASYKMYFDVVRA